MKKTYKFEKIVFIIADTLRAKNVGIYGKVPSQTPNIDRLADNGVVFKKAYCSITCTDPSITSIMSGKYPISMGLLNHGPNITEEEERNLASEKFLAEILRDNAYYTIAIDWMDRWHKRGYNRYSGRIKSKGITNWVINKPPKYFYLRFLDKISVSLLRREFFLRLYYSLSKNPQIPYDPADSVIDKAINELERVKKKKIFLYIHLWDCHHPYTRSKGFQSYLKDKVEKTYEDELSFLDGQVGRLFKYLEKKEQLNETLIIFTSDHGENFSGPGRPFNHEGLTEDIVHVPLIFSNPAFKSKIVPDLIQHVDILPTLLELVGIKLNNKADGYSFAGSILGIKKSIRDYVYFEDIVIRKIRFGKWIMRRIGLVKGQYKYISTLKIEKQKLFNPLFSRYLKVQKSELYNFSKDISEKDNLFAKKKNLASAYNQELLETINRLLSKSRRQKKTTVRNTPMVKSRKQSLELLKGLGY